MITNSTRGRTVAAAQSSPVAIGRRATRHRVSCEHRVAALSAAQRGGAEVAP